MDALAVMISFCGAFLLRFVDGVPYTLSAVYSFAGALPALVLLYLVGNYIAGVHRQVWRFAGAREVRVIFKSVLPSTAIALSADIIGTSRGANHPVPVSVILVGGFFTLVALTSLRYRVRFLDGFGLPSRRKQHRGAARALIYGAGEMGQALAYRLHAAPEGADLEVVGFVDDDPLKLGRRLHGKGVLGNGHALKRLVDEHAIDLVVIAMYNVSSDRMSEILALSRASAARIQMMPSLVEMIGGGASPSLLREPRPEDLLGRQTFVMDVNACHELLGNKNVLVTGAAGSIGSELCRQIAAFGPHRLVALDNNESGLFDLGIELRAIQPSLGLGLAVNDVTDERAIEKTFSAEAPDVIFHVAAYKHVPLMEEFPEQAVRVNVGGTWTVLNAAMRHNAGRFLLVSTDKAVNPTSVMGATKRLAEMMVVGGAPLSTSGASATRVNTLRTAVRFGNVLGSRGSVLPTFIRQLQLGRPITVTDPEMTRYFMSISEAASLILEAASLTSGGETFMLEMGDRIRIDDLARRLLRMRGLRPDVDVPIIYTGIRPGEKLHEELSYMGETRHPTRHPRIYRLKDETSATNVFAASDIIAELNSAGNGTSLVETLLRLSTPKVNIPSPATARARQPAEPSGWIVAQPARLG